MAETQFCNARKWWHGADRNFRGKFLKKVKLKANFKLAALKHGLHNKSRHKAAAKRIETSVFTYAC
ncbi:MAG: hypothetical protein CMK64_11070 [Pseudoalteromonas sp.]|nr:hypothetical protein [Pseudoalteromonas sp.]